MLGAIPKVTITPQQIAQLRRLGYEFMQNRSTKSRFFAVRGKPARRTHHLHLVKYGGAEWRWHPSFRDYLRKHKRTATEYIKLKQDLAQQFSKDRKRYGKGKIKFIRKIMRRAVR